MKNQTKTKNPSFPFSLSAFCFLLFSLLPFSTFAQGGTTGPLTWQITGNTLTISGNGAMPDYVYPDYAPWYPYNESIYTVVMQAGVATIGSCAFLYCGNLTSVTIPNNVTTIGSGAFYYCGNLTSVTIPNNVTTIGSGAFYYTNLTSITLPNNITSIGENAFASCWSLQTVNFNAIHCTYMGTLNSPVFMECYHIKTLNIGNEVQTIPDHAFRECAELTSVNFSNNNTLTSIGINAFAFCTNLTSITLPNSLLIIKLGAFIDCSKLSSVTFSNTLTSIETSAFRNCINLASISLPNSLISIGSRAFMGCTKLTAVTIPENVTNIGAVLNEAIGGSFSDCSSLKTVNFNAKNCTHLSPEQNLSIFNNSPVTTLNIGEMVQVIPERAFYGCSGITSITTHAETPPTVPALAFFNVPANTPVYTPCGAYSNYKSASGWGNYFTNIIRVGPDKQQICMISVDEKNHNEIIWKKQDEVIVYNIYREGIQSGEYDLVATVDHNAPNIWVDMESNAKIRSYSYIISAVDDKCEVSSNAHKTMHLTINAGMNNSWNLIWTPYEGTPFSTYNIYRATGYSMGELELIGTMPAGNTSFSDFTAPAGYVYYLVEILLNETCNVGKAGSSIKSNIASNNPNVGIEELQVTSYELQVYPNPTTGELRVTSYELQVTSVEIFDMVGRKYEIPRCARNDGENSPPFMEGWQPKADGVVLNISHLSSGIYFLRITTEQGEVVKKVVKE